MQQQIIREMQTYLQALSEEEKIGAINAFRQALHEISPFNNQPVDCVLWIKQTDITANDYNPNNVAPAEKRLLSKSLELDGFTQPIVVTENAPESYEIVDGFHRHELGSHRAILKRQLKGYLPVTCLRKARQEKFDRMATTIRHNRARDATRSMPCQKSCENWCLWAGVSRKLAWSWVWTAMKCCD